VFHVCCMLVLVEDSTGSSLTNMDALYFSVSQCHNQMHLTLELHFRLNLSLEQ
jgi:hypothetical protein